MGLNDFASMAEWQGQSHPAQRVFLARWMRLFRWLRPVRLIRAALT